MASLRVPCAFPENILPGEGLSPWANDPHESPVVVVEGVVWEQRVCALIQCVPSIVWIQAHGCGKQPPLVPSGLLTSPRNDSKSQGPPAG